METRFMFVGTLEEAEYNTVVSFPSTASDNDGGELTCRVCREKLESWAVCRAGAARTVWQILAVRGINKIGATTLTIQLAVHHVRHVPRGMPLKHCRSRASKLTGRWRISRYVRSDCR